MEVSEPKWVNSLSTIIGVNWLRLGESKYISEKNKKTNYYKRNYLESENVLINSNSSITFEY